MTTPTTPDLAAIAERCADDVLGNGRIYRVNKITAAIQEATAPLQAEVERLREVNQVANSLIGNQANENDRIVKQLQSELTTLRADKERLDWMDNNRREHIYAHFKYNRSLAATQKTWRLAIDSAIQNEKGKE